MIDSDDPSVRSAEQKFAALGQWISALDQLPQTDNDQWVSTSLLKSAHRAYAHLRDGYGYGDSTHCVWACRSLLELRIFARYVTRSSVERKRFIHDYVIDLEQYVEAQRNLAVQRELDLESFDEQLNSIREQKKKHGWTLPGKYLGVAEVAKDVGLESEFQLMNKVYSKMVHPTALSILTVDLEKEPAERNIFFSFGAEYLVALLDDMLPFTREAFNNDPSLA